MSREQRVIYDKAMQEAQSDVILYWGPRNQNRFNDIFEDIEYILIGKVVRFLPKHREQGIVSEYILKDQGRNLVWSVEPGTYLFDQLNELPEGFHKLNIQTLKGKRVFLVQPLTSKTGYSFQRPIEIIQP